MENRDNQSVDRELTPLKRALKALKVLGAELEDSQRQFREPIAVVGIGCRFPGGVFTPDDYWGILQQQVDAVGDVPPYRWDAGFYYDSRPGISGKSVTKQAAFIEGADTFDANFFGISPREAISMDPQQRLLLEVSWEALERAGLSPKSLAGNRTGVFVGITTNDFLSLIQGEAASLIDPYIGTGGAFCVAAGRISYVFGFTGPSMAIDTACSSSLVSVHLACQNLRLRKCDVALAGGVNMLLSPKPFIYFSKLGAISADGRSRTFDAAAGGYGRGEGCGVIVLKRLSDAVLDGSAILAVIRGTAINHDGRSSGLTVPNGKAQQAVIRDALADAVITADEVGFVESHGTGTPLGDPIELRALAESLCQNRTSDNPLYVGAVKTNIGHLEGAAGIAGLIKAILVLQHGIIPANLHFRTPNPHFDWNQYPITVPTDSTVWHSPRNRYIAGVSSFGLSGTNAHVILEKAPKVEPRRSDPDRPQHVFSLSAHDADALINLAARYKSEIDRMPSAEIADICHTANTGRTDFSHRIAIVAGGLGELSECLGHVNDPQRCPALFTGRASADKSPRAAFLFTGQGSQYSGMGKLLYETQPGFRKALDRCDELLKPYLDRSLLSVMFASGSDTSLLNQTGYAQPALFSLEYALCQLWQSWGIEPFAMMGHSVGEYVAAHAAGVFSLEDGLKLIAERARLMQSLPPGGKMAAVFADVTQLMPVLSSYAGHVSIAAVNGPLNTVISGTIESMDRVVAQLAADGIQASDLEVSHAFHSPLMEPIQDRFEAVALSVAYGRPRCGLISNLTGEMASGDDIVTSAYWRNHIRRPVQFSKSMASLYEMGCTHFIEIGPHPVLIGMGRQCIVDEDVQWLSSLRRQTGDWHQMLESLGRLYVSGFGVDWNAFDHDYSRRKVLLPTYPFQRQRYWYPFGGDPLAQTAPAGLGQRKFVPLPGREIRVATEDVIFETEVGLRSNPYLEDHRIHGEVVVPGAFHISLALSAAEKVISEGACRLEEINFLKALVPSESEERTVQTVLRSTGPGQLSFQISSFADSEAELDSAWTLHASGKIVADSDISHSTLPTAMRPEDIKARCAPMPTFPETLFAAARQAGIVLGPLFQWIGSTWIGNSEALCQLRIPDGLTNLQDFTLHPTLIDSFFQLLAAILVSRRLQSELYVPVEVGEFKKWRPIVDGDLWCYASLNTDDRAKSGTFEGNLLLGNAQGNIVAEVRHIVLKKANMDVLLNDAFRTLDQWLYQVDWQVMDRVPGAGEARLLDQHPRKWMVFGSGPFRDALVAGCSNAHADSFVVVMPGEEYCIGEDGVYYVNPTCEKDFHRLLEDVAPPGTRPLSGILYLWGLDFPDIQPMDASQLDASSERLSCGILNTLKALGQAEGERPPRLWIVTRGVQPVGEPPIPVSVRQSILWGIGRAVASEHPEIWGGLIDLGPTESSLDIPMLWEEFRSPDGETQLAFRDGKRFAARFVRSKIEKSRDRIPTQSRTDATCLITGGLGGLGLAVAGNAANRFGNLVLVGRSAPSATADRTIQELEKSGIKVLTIRADVSLEADVRRILGEIEKNMPPLRGVVHCAGVLDDGILVRQDWRRFKKALDPKVLGAWNLHTMTAGMDLDFFVLFSSTSSIFGPSGQSNYAAANTFLDALAHHRRSANLHALSINWGAWASVGMAAAAADTLDSRLRDAGISSIDLRQGLHLLELLMDSSAAQVSVLPIDWHRFFRSFEAGIVPAFFRDLDLTQTRGAAAGFGGSGKRKYIAPRAVRPTGQGDFLKKLTAAEGAKRQGMVEGYVADQLAKILFIPRLQIDLHRPIIALGLDSMMAVELRNKISHDIRINISMKLFLQGSSISQIAEIVLGRLSEELPGTGGANGSALRSDSEENGSEEWIV